MADLHRGSRLAWLWFAVPAAAMAGLLFIHAGFQVDPRLVSHRQGVVLLADWPFFRPFLDQPGGLVEYAAAWLMQAYEAGLAGAAVLAILSLAIAGFVWAVLAGVGGGACRTVARPAAGAVASLAVMPMLAVLAGRYDFPLASLVAVAVALAASAAYVWLCPHGTGARAAAGLLAVVAAYYAAGPTGLLAVVVAATYELIGIPSGSAAGARPQPCRPLGLAYLAVGMALPWLAAQFFGVSLKAAWWRLVPPASASDLVALVAAWALVAYPAAAAVVEATAARCRLPAATAPAEAAACADPAGPAPPGNAPRPRHLRLRAAARAAVAVLLTAATVVLAIGSLDHQERSLLAVDYHAEHGSWADVLAEARLLRRWNPYVHAAVVRALYHSGRLLEDLFSYPQGPQPEPPAGLEDFYRSTDFLRAGRTLLETGRVNEAEHALHEALEILGPRPAVLERLAVVNMVQGRPEAADVFLAALQKAPGHGAWAAERRKALATDPALAADAEVSHLRLVRSKVDCPGPRRSEETLRDLLRVSPRNRMAFEYLVVHLMLARQTEAVVEHLPYAAGLGYVRLPRHLEEAVLQAARERPGVPIALPGLAVRPETESRFRAYLARLSPHRRDRAGAWNALCGDFGDTYWFYWTFGCTPHGRSGPPAAGENG